MHTRYKRVGDSPSAYVTPYGMTGTRMPQWIRSAGRASLGELPGAGPCAPCLTAGLRPSSTHLRMRCVAD